jgi:hypothetical protein
MAKKQRSESRYNGGLKEIRYVLYWEEAGKIPLESEVQQRLEHLRTHGPTPYAFTFDEAFTLEQALHFTKKRKS